ncbi:CHAD domain-containing protein [Carboxylicivirga sp. A043]|uniref:CHAD domain-containing protein n=1 Tax=Carboxylicivirga litoralis TaxID=2816963 RepID=UPI0021CAFCE5|nr:CHAD domain-containing protein [Carboxylicivirga sp. A043]MCU4154885.1 CHAD domain-containing protein [Carboxylicivirga sp. A043]
MYRFAIDNQEELQEGITRVLKEQYAFIRYHTTIPNDIDTSVHEIRKAIKRIRAILRLVRWDIGEELYQSENMRFRDLGRQLSQLRDYHVIITYLAENFEAEELRIPEENFINLINHLNSKKEAELKRLVDNQTLETIREQMDISTSELNEFSFDYLGPHTIRQGTTNTYSQCLNKISESQLKLDDHPLHELRKRVKYLLNQMILIQEVWPEFFKNYSTSLKEASDLLGDDHNIAESVTLIDSLSEDVISRENKNSLIDSFRSEREHIHRELWPLLGKLFTEDAKCFVKRITSYWLISRE